MITPPDLLDGRAEGEQRRDAALGLLRAYRRSLVLRVQRGFLMYLLAHGPDTCDPVRALVPIPAGTDPRLVGAAVRGLAEAGVIHSVGRRKSRRSKAHARHLEVWAIRDRFVALAWLRDHPDDADAEPDAPPVDSLF
jgi:hypothetical protein